jgi:hypothetical protein
MFQRWMKRSLFPIYFRHTSLDFRDKQTVRHVYISEFPHLTRYKMYVYEFYALYSSPNIIQVIKSRTLRWAGHVARMEIEVHIGF